MNCKPPKFVSFSHMGSSDAVVNVYKCRCGKTFKARELNVKYGGTRSCGCFRKEVSSKRQTKHGETRKKPFTSEYQTWSHMKSRCYNKKAPEYHRYGGRGITICRRWKNNYEAFLRDMGRKPGREYSIDRINNGGNYEPSNCRWATVKEQANNRRTSKFFEYIGKRKTVPQWAEELKISSSLIWRRIQLGWTIAEALSLPKGTWR